MKKYKCEYCEKVLDSGNLSKHLKKEHNVIYSEYKKKFIYEPIIIDNKMNYNVKYVDIYLQNYLV